MPICLVAAACSDEAPPDPANGEEDVATLSATPESEVQTLATIGPVEYGFSPERLTRAEIQLRLPPDDAASIWATKLIPAERASMLGAPRCRYGASKRPQTCTAELEDGVALALLERPFDHYVQGLAASTDNNAPPRPVALNGAQGIEITRTADGVETAYAFYPAGERTLLVVCRPTEGGAPHDPALRDLLASVRLPPADPPLTPPAARQNR